MAVKYREIEDIMRERTERDQRFKFAAMSTGRVAIGELSISELFPELFEENDDSAEFDDDEDAVTYKFADQGELDPEEMQRELEKLLSGEDMTMNGGDLPDGERPGPS